MSIVKSGTKGRLRFDHRGGADGDKVLGVLLETRIPGGAPVRFCVDQPTVFPQSDDAARNGTVYPAQPFVIESGARPTIVTDGGVTLNQRVRTLSVGGTAFPSGTVRPLQAEPAWAPVGTSILTVIAFGNGAGDTVGVTPLGGALVTITEGAEFTAAVDNDTTAENIRLALLAVGIVAVRTDNVLAITTPLGTLTTGDATAWTVALSTPLTPAIAALIPKGRYDGFTPAWPRDPNGSVPNSGHRPAGELLRVRWLGTPIAAEVIDAGGNTGFTATLANPQNIAPGSVVVLASVGGNVITIRDDGAGRLVGQELTGNESADGTIDYLTGVVTLAFSAATAGNVTADYEHGCLYLPLDISMEWDAEMASG